jgi:hypothetical protein
MAQILILMEIPEHSAVIWDNYSHLKQSNMKKQKLKLDELKVHSFVTSDDQNEKLKAGGEGPTTILKPYTPPLDGTIVATFDKACVSLKYPQLC